MLRVSLRPSHLMLLIVLCSVLTTQQALSQHQPPQTPPAAAKSTGPTGTANSPSEIAPFLQTEFVYRAEAKKLASVLQDFAASQGMPAIVDPSIDGVVTGSFDTTGQAFMDTISRAYGVIWYSDGAALYFYPGSAMQSRIFRLKGYPLEQVRQLLSTLKLDDPRYPLLFDKGQQTLMVNGPPRHVQLIALALESLDVGAMERNKRVVRVVALKFASAADRKLGDTHISGIVSTLRALYGSSTLESSPGTTSTTPGQGVQNGRNSAQQAAKSIQAIFAGGGSQHRLNPEPRSGGATENAEGQSPATPTQNAQRGLHSPISEDDEQTVSFQADESNNAVIVYGRQNRILEYVELIRKLDQPPIQVELEAMIIDVRSDSIHQLGVDWSARSSTANARITVEGGSSAQASTQSADKGYTITTLLGKEGRDLIARIQAMQSDGKARIVSKPKVLGVANRASTMQDKSIANVRVGGTYDTNLYQVEAGTLLQVTPQVIPTGPQSQSNIKLSLFIEDGIFMPAMVDQVPIVKKTEIRTEAHVGNGDSLLIGGIVTDNVSDGQSGVPGLSRIPVLGALFRWKSSQSSRTERLFLITPHVVDANGIITTNAQPHQDKTPSTPGTPPQETLTPPPRDSNARQPLASQHSSPPANATTTATTQATPPPGLALALQHSARITPALLPNGIASTAMLPTGTPSANSYLHPSLYTVHSDSAISPLSFISTMPSKRDVPQLHMSTSMLAFPTHEEILPFQFTSMRISKSVVSSNDSGPLAIRTTPQLQSRSTIR